MFSIHKMNITAHRLFYTEYIRSLPDSMAETAESDFFCYLQLRNGTFKSTTSDRLTDVNNATTSYFSTIENPPRSFLDVAVSSGVSTDEWYENLLKAGFKGVEMLGTDSTLHAYLIEFNKYFRVLVQNCNFPLQYDLLGIAIKANKFRRLDYINGVYIISKFLKFIYHIASEKYQLVKLLNENNFTNNDKWLYDIDNVRIIIRKLKLISPRLIKKNNVIFSDDDLSLQNPPSLKNRFDVIRAANILNLVYFPEKTLITFLNRLKERLRGPGSFIIICRTNDHGKNNATLFKLNCNYRFEVVFRVGAGSEIEDIVLSLPECS